MRVQDLIKLLLLLMRFGVQSIEAHDEAEKDVENYNCVVEHETSSTNFVKPERYLHMDEEPLTDSFDPRIHLEWADCRARFMEVPKQGRWDCWAHIAALTLSQRLCINSPSMAEQSKISLSTRYIATCGKPKQNACLGGNMADVNQLLLTGIFSGSTAKAREQGCQPYLLPGCTPGDDDFPGCKKLKKKTDVLDAGSCSSECDDPKVAPTPYAKRWDGGVAINVRLMQDEVKKGPLIAKIVSNDTKKKFKKYTGGVLHVPLDAYKKENPGHYVAIIGYNAESKPKYWIVTNTWGERWGEGGFARIEFNVNMLKLESDVVFFFPPSRVPVPGTQIHVYETENGPSVCQSLEDGMKCQPGHRLYGYDRKVLRFGCFDSDHPLYEFYKRNHSAPFTGRYSRIVRLNVRVPRICY